MIQLELPSPENVLGWKIEPCPDWTLDGLFSELEALESKFSAVSLLSKEKSRDVSGGVRSGKGFTTRVGEGEADGLDDEVVKEKEEVGLSPGYRFGCDDLYVSESDDSEDELVDEVQGPLVEKASVAEDVYLSLHNEFQLGIQEGIRNRLSSVEAGLQDLKVQSSSNFTRIQENSEEIHKLDRKRDMDHQRLIAEFLDGHLTTIQRDHEHRSQLEQKRIQDDAAREEARRKEKALQEEKLRQEKAKAAEEAETARQAEEARKAVLEAERKAVEEAAERAAKENSTQHPAVKKFGKGDDPLGPSSNVPPSEAPGKSQSLGGGIRAAERALKEEEKRRLNYEEIYKNIQTWMSSSNKDIGSHERKISRVIRQISGSVENVRAKAKELLNILSDPGYPQFVSMAILAKKIVSVFEISNASDSSAFACGQVIVIVSAQVPQLMDILVAELHRVCIYTVPKHVVFSKSAFEERNAYFRAIGYREEDGKMEETDRYLARLESCMKFYGALIQTQVQGMRNMHGLEEGWVWLARFLNVIPANRNTAVALAAFLSTAGFALHTKYKSHFRKLLDVINQHFLGQLKKVKDDPKVSIKIRELQEYIESRKFLVEPEGSRLQTSLLSNALTPGAEEQRYPSPNRYFY
ncbi:hypothetical protein Droror1_Dr00018670 [Drosera rotundifolia]